MKKLQSIIDLLASRGAKLRSLSEGAANAEGILESVRSCLPADCQGSVWAASEKEGQITLMVASPSDASRLHYALPVMRTQLAIKLNRAITKLHLRVRPAPKDTVGNSAPAS